jgi:Uma2 family endonuclease
MVASLAVPIRRLTPENVVAMVEAGILDEDDRLELVDGVLIEMSPVGNAHEVVKENLNWYFSHEASHRVRVESMFLYPGGYVLPDLQVALAFPGGEELPHFSPPLVVEIAQSSHARDREKAAIYAERGVPEYWIVDVIDRIVVVHREPADAGYASVTEHQTGVIVPLIDAPPLALSTLFGPKS